MPSKLVPVEPLSEKRWGKIERSIFEQLETEPKVTSRPDPPHTRRRYAALAFAAAAVCAGIVLFVLVFQDAFGRGSRVLASPSRITTGVTSSHLALKGVSLDVKPQSTVLVSGDDDRSLLIVLDRGGITCDVEPRAAHSPLIVQAGAVRVRVIGTRFSVTRLGESARVEVQHGVVEVSSEGSRVRVRAGEQWPRSAAISRPEASNSAPLPAPAAERPSDESSSDHDPKPMSKPLPRSAAASAPATGSTPAEVQREKAAAAAAAPVEPPFPQARYEAAARLEVSDPAGAMAAYRGLESGNDSWAQNALFAHGRLAAARGNKAEARRLLSEYLRRFPRGANADDARTVLKRLK